MKITITTPEVKDLEKRLAEEADRAEAWELRSEELEQELRDAQDRIHEQDWTLAQYDDDNRKLREANADAANDVLYYKEDNEQYKKDAQKIGERLAKAEAERDEYRKDRNRLMDECTKLRGKNPVSLNEWAERIHRIAVSHGWWESEYGKCDDGDRPFPEIVALCHSEMSEALEEYRSNKPMAYIDPGFPHEYVEDPKTWPSGAKPEGIAVEMLDCVIRILDWMGHEGVEVDTLMEKKVKYNESREHRHGGKKA